MTQKEKAKAYDEALESIKKFLAEFKRRMPKDVFEDAKTIFEDNFPELAESEDEKIRKTLIEIFSSNGKKDWRNIPTGKIIAWLEKQGKPKWTDEDEERLQSCIISLQGKGLMGGVDTMDSKWLKSLKQRMEEQQ